MTDQPSAREMLEEQIARAICLAYCRLHKQPEWNLLTKAEQHREIDQQWDLWTHEAKAALAVRLAAQSASAPERTGEQRRALLIAITNADRSYNRAYQGGDKNRLTKAFIAHIADAVMTFAAPAPTFTDKQGREALENTKCETTNASSMCAAMSSDRPITRKSDSTSTVPVTELPDSVRIPLHSLQADLEYLIGRVIADNSCGPMIVKSMSERLDQIETFLSLQPLTIDPATVEAAEAVRKILFENFYTGEPGQHGAIKIALTAICAVFAALQIRGATNNQWPGGGAPV